MATEDAKIDAVVLWRKLSEREQLDALVAFWATKDDPISEFRERLLKSLAKAKRFKFGFVDRAPPEKKAEFLRDVLRARRQPFVYCYDYFIRAWLVEHRRNLLEDFLSGAGVPHRDGYVDCELPPTAQQLDGGILAVSGRHDPRDVGVYLVYLANFNQTDLFQRLKETNSYRRFAEPLLKEEPSGEKVEDEAAEEEESNPEDPDNEDFTSLDKLLIDTAVASAFKVEGAPDEDRVGDLVEEVVELNATRHRSVFLRGFYHALFDKEFTFHFPGENPVRRQWYLCGVLFGLIRQKRLDDAIEILTQGEPDLGLELAGSVETPCGSKLLPLIYMPLLRGQHTALALKFLRAQFPLLTSTGRQIEIALEILDYASDLIRRGHATDAEPLVDLIRFFTSHPNVSLPELIEEHLSVHGGRRKAQCLQAKGSFERARALILDLEKKSADQLQPNAIADLGLVEGSFRSLAAALPKADNEKNKGLVEGLSKGRNTFEKVIDAAGEDATNAHFCLGILKTLQNGSPQERADHFQCARGGMLEKPDAYAANGIKDWTNFLLALALLETGEPSNVLPAVDYVAEAIDGPVRFPLIFWQQIFEAAALLEDSDLPERIARHLMGSRAEAPAFLLENAAIISHSDELLGDVLVAYMEQPRPIRERWSKLRKLLPHALRSGAVNSAGTILDFLEEAARGESEFRPGFVELLKDSDEYSPAWDTEDAQRSLINLLEIGNCSDEAAAFLRERFLKLHHSGAPHCGIEQLEIVERLKELKSPAVDIVQLESLLSLEEPAGLTVALSAKVLYIGGNEKQAAYERRIRQELGQEHPNLQIEFYLPGWDSSWNKHLQRLAPMIEKADAVVIHRFVRTQLGRHLRRHCGSENPWLGCTGHGLESLKRAIVAAARFVS